MATRSLPAAKVLSNVKVCGHRRSKQSPRAWGKTVLWQRPETQTLCPASLGNRNNRKWSVIIVTHHNEHVYTKTKSQNMPSSFRIQTHSLKFCSSHLDDASHMNKETRSEVNKSWWRIQQVPFYTFGYPPMMSRPCGLIGLELFNTCFRNRSCWLH